MNGRQEVSWPWVEPPVYVEVFGSPERSLSRLLWTHKNVPETEFGFLLDRTAALIALELHSEQSSQQAYGCIMKVPHSKHGVILHVVGLIHMNERMKLPLNKRDTRQPVSARLFHCFMMLNSWLNFCIFKSSKAKLVSKMMNKMTGLTLF